MASTGTIVQVIGSTFDARFPEDDLPDLYNAVTVDLEVDGVKSVLFGEVSKHLGGGDQAVRHSEDDHPTGPAPGARAPGPGGAGEGHRGRGGQEGGDHPEPHERRRRAGPHRHGPPVVLAVHRGEATHRPPAAPRVGR